MAQFLRLLRRKEHNEDFFLADGAGRGGSLKKIGAADEDWEILIDGTDESYLSSTTYHWPRELANLSLTVQ